MRELAFASSSLWFLYALAVYFAITYALRRAPRFVPRPWRRLGAPLGCCTAFGVTSLALGILLVPGVLLALSLLGVDVAVVAVVLADRRPPRVSTSLACVGRRILPIYVLHLPVLAAMHHWLVGVDLSGFGAVAALYPVAGTAIAVAACLASRRILVALGLTWLFALPGRVTTANPTQSQWADAHAGDGPGSSPRRACRAADVRPRWAGPSPDADGRR